MDEKSAADVLEEAADVLLVHGRCIGRGREHDGRFCVLGAIAEAIQPGWWMEDADSYWHLSESRLDVLTPLEARVGAPLSIWNDHDVRDDDAVRDALLLVAKDLRNEATS